MERHEKPSLAEQRFEAANSRRRAQELIDFHDSSSSLTVLLDLTYLHVGDIIKEVPGTAPLPGGGGARLLMARGEAH